MKIYKIDTGEVVEPPAPSEEPQVPPVRNTLRAAFRAGFEGFGRIWPTSLLLWATGLIGALVPTVMVGRVLDRAVGRSLLADELLSGFDAAWYGEFIHAHAPRLEAVPFVSVLASAGVLVIYLLLLGGALDQLIKGDPFRFRRLVRSGAARLTGLIWLTLCFLPLLGVVALIYGLIGSLLKTPVERVSSEIFAIGLNLLHLFLLAVLFAAYRVALDYARVALVAAGDISPFRAIARALGFIRRRIILAFLPLLAGWLSCLVLIAVYAVIAGLIHPAGLVSVAFLVLVQGLLLAAFQAVRLFTYSWELGLMRTGGETRPGP